MRNRASRPKPPPEPEVDDEELEALRARVLLKLERFAAQHEAEIARAADLERGPALQPLPLPLPAFEPDAPRIRRL